MTRLPVLSAREVIRALSKAGYYVRDQKGRAHDFIVMVYDLVPDDEAFAAQ